MNERVWMLVRRHLPLFSLPPRLSSCCHSERSRPTFFLPRRSHDGSAYAVEESLFASSLFASSNLQCNAYEVEIVDYH